MSLINFVFFLSLLTHGDSSLTHDQKVKRQALDFCKKNIPDYTEEAHDKNCALIKNLIINSQQQTKKDFNGKVTTFPLASFFIKEGQRNKNYYSKHFKNGSVKDVYDHACKILINPFVVARKMSNECSAFCRDNDTINSDCTPSCHKSIRKAIAEMKRLHLYFHKINQECLQTSQNKQDTQIDR